MSGDKADVSDLPKASDTFIQPSSSFSGQRRAKRPRSDCEPSSAEVSTESAREQGRQSINEIMLKEKVEVDNFDIRNVLQQRCKRISSKKLNRILNRCNEAFKKIQKVGSEPKLQVLFNDFFNAVFCDSQLTVHDTSQRALNWFPTNACLLTHMSRPDFTFTDKDAVHGIFTRMVAQLKPDLSASSGHLYFKAYKQLRENARDILLNYGYVVPRDEVWGFSSDGQEFNLYKFYIDKNDLFRHEEYYLGQDVVVEVLVKFAYCYKFEPFEMNVTLEGNQALDLNSIATLAKMEIIHHTKLSIVLVKGKYVIKINGSPSSKKSLDNEKEMYKQLKNSNPNLPLLTVLGEYDSPAKNCSAIVFKERGTILDTVQGMHRIMPVLKHMHFLGFVHCDVRIANILRDSPNDQIYLIDFGFSCRKDETTSKHGSLETVSEKLLEQIKNGNNNVIVTAVDDLLSLVNAMILLFFNRKMYRDPIEQIVANSEKVSAAAKLLLEWEKIKKKSAVKHIFDKALKLAEAGDHDGLQQEMLKIEESV